MSLKKYNFTCSGKIDHVSMAVNADNIDGQMINDLTEEFGIIGLHPCGDLATTLLRLYSFNEKAKFICVVGCCYMKLTQRFL